MTTPPTSPTPASAPWTGTGGGATCPEAAGERAGRAALEEEYALLMGTVAACSERGDHEAEAELRNRAQVVLAGLHRLGTVPPAVPPGDAEQA
jgi:hypothetical protein